MKGGSAASDAVSSLVSEPAYASLTKNFSNFLDSAKCGGGRRKVAKAAKKPVAAKAAKKPVAAKAAKKPVAKRGGSSDPFTAVSNAVTKAMTNVFNRAPAAEHFNVFKSSPAAAGYEMANLRGNNASAVKGGSFQAKNMSQYANSSKYSVKNRKGGSSGLDYSVISSTSDMKGVSNVRATPEAVNRLMASNTIVASPAMDKTATYGSVKDVGHFFNYAGLEKLVSPVAQGGKCGKCACVKKTKSCKKST